MGQSKLHAIRRTMVVATLLLAVVSIIPATATAQERGAVQVFLGYSFIEMVPAGKDIACAGSCPPEVEGFEIEKEKMSGFHSSLTYWMTGRLGIMGEFSAHYNGEFPLPPNASGLTRMDFEQVEFLVGPRIKMMQRGRLSSSFRAVFGASIGTTFPAVADINDDVIGPTFRFADETVFAMDLGVSFDISVNDSVAIRLIQPNFNITNYANESQKNFRFSSGVIFNLGG